jgi:hypothetical protein
MSKEEILKTSNDLTRMNYGIKIEDFFFAFNNLEHKSKLVELIRMPRRLIKTKIVPSLSAK